MSPYAAQLSRRGLAGWMLCGLATAWAADGAELPSLADAQPASPAVEAGSQHLFDFNIAAQPLIVALNQFALVSGRAALFPGTLVSDRRSSSVQGRYTAKDALHRLLEGSGLDVEEVGTGRVTALILTQASPQAASAAAAATRSNTYSLGGYESLVQARVWEAICANPRTSASSYRSLLRFQVDAAGHVQQPRLLTSTGDGRRDAALLEEVERIHLDQSPPSQMTQPVTMLILPQQADGPVCTTGKH